MVIGVVDSIVRLVFSIALAFEVPWDIEGAVHPTVRFQNFFTHGFTGLKRQRKVGKGSFIYYVMLCSKNGFFIYSDPPNSYVSVNTVLNVSKKDRNFLNPSTHPVLGLT